MSEAHAGPVSQWLALLPSSSQAVSLVTVPPPSRTISLVPAANLAYERELAHTIPTRTADQCPRWLPLPRLLQPRVGPPGTPRPVPPGREKTARLLLGGAPTRVSSPSGARAIV